MSAAFNELTRDGLREYRNHERQLLERVQQEALTIERLPEGEEPRDSVIVDGHDIGQPKRIRGTLTVRW